MTTKWIWASLAIVAMWAAVVLVGIYGPDVVVDNDTSHVRVPALAIVVAVCAFIATLVLAWRGFSEPRTPTGTTVQPARQGDAELDQTAASG